MTIPNPLNALIYRMADIPAQPSDDLFRAYVETANDIVYTLDLNGTFTFVNSYGLKLLGVEESDVVGHSYLEIVAPEYREATSTAFLNLLSTGELRDYEFVVQSRSGEYIYIEVNGRLLYQQGQLVGGLGIGRNITERKRFEQQLKMFSKALDAAHDSAIITDLEGKILYANLATSRIFGYPLTALKDANATLFYPKPEQSHWILRQGQGEGWSGQVVCCRQGGESFPALISVGPVCDESDQPIAVSIIYRDITQLEHIKAELASKNLELERANRLKSEFLANMSHELRTPMTSILGFSSLLAQQLFGDLNERQRLYVQQIHHSGEHLLTLINEVLDLSKIEAGQMELCTSPITVATLCQDVLDMVSAQAKQKHLTMHCSIQPKLDYLIADELRVRQMLLNLLSNAIKFSEDGGEIGVDAHLDGVWLLLKVWDQGIGIPHEKQELLFQPFQQLDSSLSRRHEGTGLGLVLTQRLARLHGGEVTLVSQSKQGSCFTIRLPLKGPQAHVIQPFLGQDAPMSLQVTKTEASQGSLTGEILLVEDHPVNAMLIEHMLQYWGYQTYHALNGQMALEWLEGHKPTLILMDIHLPDLDGLEVAKQIRSHPDWQDIPIVATTAMAMTDDRERCLKAGMQEYLSKPINSSELVSVLAKYTWKQSD